jgi:hypothetical protein
MTSCRWYLSLGDRWLLFEVVEMVGSKSGVVGEGVPSRRPSSRSGAEKRSVSGFLSLNSSSITSVKAMQYYQSEMRKLTYRVALSASDQDSSNSQEGSREAEDESKYIAIGH